MLVSDFILAGLGAGLAKSDSLPPTESRLSAYNSTSYPLPVHNITRFSNSAFENLTVRENGQILTTTSNPRADVYQVNPLAILAPTRIHRVSNLTSAFGITEGERDVFHVASGEFAGVTSTETFPKTYGIIRIDMRDVDVQPDGSLSRQPIAKRVASVPGAALPNSVAFAAPGSDHLLMANSFRELIWNINVRSGEIGIALNDSTTAGPSLTGGTRTGVNGLKVCNGIMFWTNTGRSAFYKVPIDPHGQIWPNVKPTLVSTVTEGVDDFVVDPRGNAFIAGPLGVITRVNPIGQQQVVAGTLGSNSSVLHGATAVRFGRLASDRWSLYITTDGGVPPVFPQRIYGTEGVSRIDLEGY